MYDKYRKIMKYMFVYIYEIDINGPRSKIHRGMVFQTGKLFPHLNFS